MPSFLTRPLTTKPKTMAEQFAEEFDPSNTAVADRGMVKPFMAGAMQGVGDVITDFTTPLGIASLAAGPLGRLRNLASIGRLVQGERALGQLAGRFGRTANIVDEAGRPLLQAGGYAGKVVKGAKATESSRRFAEDAKALESMKEHLIPRTKTTPRVSGID